MEVSEFVIKIKPTRNGAECKYKDCAKDIRDVDSPLKGSIIRTYRNIEFHDKPALEDFLAWCYNYLR